jgi:hypothetical protein
MKPVRHRTRKLAWTLTLAVAALLLPASLAHAQHGGGGGHAGPGGSGSSHHHGHHAFSGGSGWVVGGYYPDWGYGPFYGGYSGYGIFGPNVAADPYFGVYAPGPYFGVFSPYSGGSPFGQSTTFGVFNFMDSF